MWNDARGPFQIGLKRIGVDCLVHGLWLRDAAA